MPESPYDPNQKLATPDRTAQQFSDVLDLFNESEADADAIKEKLGQLIDHDEAMQKADAHMREVLIEHLAPIHKQLNYITGSVIALGEGLMHLANHLGLGPHLARLREEAEQRAAEQAEADSPRD